MEPVFDSDLGAISQDCALFVLLQKLEGLGGRDYHCDGGKVRPVDETVAVKPVLGLPGTGRIDIPNEKLDIGGLVKREPDVHAANVERCMEGTDVSRCVEFVVELNNKQIVFLQRG